MLLMHSMVARWMSIALLVPKGAPNAENAMRLINELLSAEAQARLAVTMPLGPVNTGAFDTGIISGRDGGQGQHPSQQL